MTTGSIGDLGDDKVIGGAGNGDEVAGDLGIDIVNGGPGNEDLVHGDYGWDRMSGGAGKGDIASFATAVAGGKGDRRLGLAAKHRALGDGHDKLFGFESLEGSAFRDTLIGNGQANAINGGPGDDHLIGGGGPDTLIGGQGSDGCKGAKGRTDLLRQGKAAEGLRLRPARPAPSGGAGLQIVGGAGPDDFTVSFDEASDTFAVTRREAAGDRPRLHPPGGDARPRSPARRRPGPLADGRPRPRQRQLPRRRLAAAVGSVRIAGGYGNDMIHGGPEDDLLQSGPGADKLYGGDGADGLVGGLPGPTYLYGEADGDLLAAGGGCAGGALVGGPGRDDASFAETQAHPGLLYISFLEPTPPGSTRSRAATTSTSRRPTRTWRAPSTTTS